MSGAALLLVLSALPAQVVLRGESVAVDAPVLEVSEAGVKLGAPRDEVIAWDRVKLVLGPHRQDAEPFMAQATDAWRARTRLDRADYDLACPLFEALFDAWRDTPGPSLAGVADGLLRCRMRRGDSSGAVEAWLALRASGAAQRAGSLVDPVTGLAPALAPLWAPDEDLRSTAESLDRLAPLDPMAALYADAARAQAGIAIDAPPGEAPEKPGAWLVTTIVQSLSGSPEVRAEARQALLAVIDDAPGSWREAWARAAVGRSLLLEPDASAHDSAIAHLAHLPARFERSQPRLARAALLLLAREMGARGDTQSAGALAALADELELNIDLTTPTPDAE